MSQFLFGSPKEFFVSTPMSYCANIYLFKFNNENTR